MLDCKAMNTVNPPHSYHEAASELPELGDPFAALYRSFWSLDSVPASTLELCRIRLAQLLGSELARDHSEVEIPAAQRAEVQDWHRSALFSAAEKACLELTEVHAMDAQAITDQQADAVKAAYGEVGYVAVIQALGVFDAVIRLALIWDLKSMEVK